VIRPQRVIYAGRCYRSDYEYSTPNTRRRCSSGASMARWTGHAGDAAGARDQYAELLPIFERVSGPEHPHTIEIGTELAYWTAETQRTPGSPGSPHSATRSELFGAANPTDRPTV
jgi:hypothetical protein